MASPSSLPTPPTAPEIDLAWLIANKATLAAYLAAVYAHQNLQIVVIKSGVRSPPVAVRVAGTAAVIEINV
jgi:hypothetical protein